MKKQNYRTVRFKFSKEAESKYLSHLDVLRIMTRALNRADIGVCYSRGFNPKPKIGFSNPIPLGIESFAEYCDIQVYEDVDTKEFLEALGPNLPAGIRLLEAAVSDKKVPALMSEIAVVFFEFEIKPSGPLIDGEASDKAIDILRKALNEYNAVHRSIYDYSMEALNNNIFLKIHGYAKIFRNEDNRIFKYNDFYDYLGNYLDKCGLRIGTSYKREAFFFKDGNLLAPLEVL